MKTARYRKHTDEDKQKMRQAWRIRLENGRTWHMIYNVQTGQKKRLYDDQFIPVGFSKFLVRKCED